MVGVSRRCFHFGREWGNIRRGEEVQGLNMCLNFSICFVVIRKSACQSRFHKTPLSAVICGKKTHLCRNILLNLLPLHPFFSPRLPSQGHHTHAFPNQNLFSRSLNSPHFLRIIGQKPDTAFALRRLQRSAEAEIDEHGGGETVAAGVGWVAEEEVRLEGVVA